jgi:hypothetical protein
MVYETLQYDPSQEITPELASMFGFDVGPPVPSIPVTNTGAIKNPLTTTTDSLQVQNSALQQPPGSIISPGLSAVSNFGMPAVSYNAFTRLAGPAVFSAQNISGTTQYSSAISAFDNVYGTVPSANSYSNIPQVTTSLSGLPFGKLPSGTQAVSSPYVTNFTTTGLLASSTLGSFGSFNFGSGGATVPQGYPTAYGSTQGVTTGANDVAGNNAQPNAVRLGIAANNINPGYVNAFGFNQAQVLNAARQQVQQGSAPTVGSNQPIYDAGGTYIGYDRSKIQPVSQVAVGPDLRSAIGQSGNSPAGFAKLNNPAVSGGDPNDFIPPPSTDAYKTKRI